MTTDVNEYDQLDFEQSTGADVAKESSKSGDFEREIEYLKLRADAASVAAGKHEVLVRFMTDHQKPHMDQPISRYNMGWITVNEHNFLNTKPRPEWVPEGQGWPLKMTLGCRKDKIFIARFGGACYGCDVLKSKPSSKTWALAVEREKVLNDKGETIGFQDKTRKVFDRDAEGNPIVLGEENGKKKYQMKDAPAWIVMNMGWKNFFGNLNGQASYFGTVLDGDWLIKRSGTTADDTNYAFVRVHEENLPNDPAFGEWAGQKYDLRLPGFMEALYPDMPDLRRLIAQRVSDDLVNRFFVPGWTPPASETQQGATTAQQGQSSTGSVAPNPAQPTPAPSSQEPPSDAMAALKARLGQKG